MSTSTLEIGEVFNLVTESRVEIEELRQKYENDYAKAHDETFNLISAKFFENLASIMTFSTSNKLVAANRFKEATELTVQFIQQYQEVYSSDFSASLKKLRDFFDAHQIFFKVFDLLDSEDKQTDKAIKYNQISEAYQLLGYLASEYWYIFNIDIRKEFEELALAIQKKTGFGIRKEPFAEVQQAWKELKQTLDLFFPSVRSGTGELFSKYKKATVYLTGSILKKANEDKELQDFKRFQETNVEQALKPSSISRKNEQSVYLPIPESDRLNKNKELITLLRIWREEDNGIDCDSSP